MGLLNGALRQCEETWEDMCSEVEPIPRITTKPYCMGGCWDERHDYRKYAKIVKPTEDGMCPDCGYAVTYMSLETKRNYVC